MTGSKHNFHTLDGLRGIAAIAVVTLHMPNMLGARPLPGAAIAVDLFFAMSGFVIAHAYDARLSQGMSASRFLLVRMIRLYPLYLAGTVISIFSIAFAVAGGLDFDGWNWPRLLASIPPGLLMVPSDAGPSHDLYALNMVAWSLFFEIAVNVVFVLAFPVLTNRVLGGVILGSAAALVYFGMTNVALDGGVWWPEFPVALARIGFAFPLGVLMCRLLRAERLPRLTMPVLIIFAATIAMMAARPQPGAGRQFYDMAALLILCPLILLCAVRNEPRRWLGLFSSLGVISYPLYMLHIPMFRVIKGVVLNGRSASLADFSPWLGAAALTFLLVFSWLADRYFDRPVRQWLTAWFRSRQRGIAGF